MSGDPVDDDDGEFVTVSCKTHAERVAERIDTGGAWFSATAEMLDEIHAMLRSLITVGTEH